MIPNRLSLRGYHNFNANATTRKGSDVFSVIKMYKTHKLQISPEKLVQAMKNVRKDILATHLCRKKRTNKDQSTEPDPKPGKPEIDLGNIN